MEKLTSTQNLKNYLSKLVVFSCLFLLPSLGWGQTGCTSSIAEVLAEYDNVFATWNVSENTAGAAAPFLYQADFPVDDPSGTFNNGIGGNQPNNIICNIGNGASNEGPDVDINVTVPVGSTTCEGVTFTVCRVGDFNGTNEVVWVWDRENNQILGCIPGTGGDECQGFGAVDCVTVMLDPVQFNAMAVDGMVQIALVTPGGSPNSNSANDVDDNCTPAGSSNGNTGNCFRLDNFMYNIGNVDPTVSITNVTGDCEDGPFTLTATGTEDPTDTPSSLGYSWSTGDMTASISVNPTEATTYTVTVTDLGTFNQGCTATETITVNPGTSPPVVVDTNIDLCNGESLPITINTGSPPMPTITELFSEDNILSSNDNGNNNDDPVCFDMDFDITGASNVDVDIEIEESGNLDNDDGYTITYSPSGSPTSPISVTNDFDTDNINITGITGTTLSLEVCVFEDNNNETINLNNITVTATYPAPPTPTYNFYDEDPALNAAAMPVATGTSYSPTVPDGEVEMIWVTCELGVCESDAVKVTIDNLCCPAPTAPIGVTKND